MDVSVIIINYNTYNLTCQCIRSVYRHTKGVEFEIILVDNASVECDAELFKRELPGISLIKNKENIGFSKANNVGIKVAKGNLILLLNSDTELLNDAISIAAHRFQSNEKLGVVSVKLLYPNGAIQYQCHRFPSIILTLAEHLRLHKLLPASIRSRVFLKTYSDHQSYMETDSIWGTFFMFKKDILRQMPGNKLDEEYFMYYEDTQWCLDIKKLGYKIAYEPAGMVTHYFAQSNAPRNEMILNNHKQFLRRNYNFVKVFILKILGV